MAIPWSDASYYDLRKAQDELMNNATKRTYEFIERYEEMYYISVSERKEMEDFIFMKRMEGTKFMEKEARKIRCLIIYTKKHAATQRDKFSRKSTSPKCKLALMNMRKGKSTSHNCNMNPMKILMMKRWPPGERVMVKEMNQVSNNVRIHWYCTCSVCFCQARHLEILRVQLHHSRAERNSVLACSYHYPTLQQLFLSFPQTT